MTIPRSRYLRLLTLVAAAALLPLPASAAETVGNTVGVTPAAIGTVSGELAVNASVYRDETVRTGPTGVLEIKFLDQTSLVLGASASARLDRFVYSGGSANDVVIGLSKGVFRFATGVSAKKAYWIETPLAGIGVRGTNFTAEITSAYERFTIWEGAIEICPREKGLSIDQERRRHCPVISKPGDTVTVFPNSKTQKGGPTVTFAANCAETSGSSRLCGHYGGTPPRGDGQTPGFTFPPFTPPPRRPQRSD